MKNKNVLLVLCLVLFALMIIPLSVSLENRYNSTDDLYLNAETPERPTYMAWRTYIKTPVFNTTNAEISNARFYFFVENVEDTPGDTFFYNCSSAFDEGSSYATINALPCTQVTSQSITAIGWYYFNITTQINDSYNGGYANITFAFNTTAILPAEIEDVRSDESSVAVGEFVEPLLNQYRITSRDATSVNRSYLNVTYTSGAEQCSPTLNEDWVITDEQVCDGKDVTTGTGKIIVQTGGLLILKGNSNVTATGLVFGKIGDNAIITKGSRLISKK